MKTEQEHNYAKGYTDGFVDGYKAAMETPPSARTEHCQVCNKALTNLSNYICGYHNCPIQSKVTVI